MTASIVLQLQELASEGHTDILDLLKKALLVATKLNLTEFKEWVRYELDGYPNPQLLPDYRRLSGDLRVLNPIRGPIPFILPDAELTDMVSEVNLTDSLPSVVSLIENCKTGFAHLAFPPGPEAMLMQLQGFAPMKPVRIVARNQLSAIVESVRTTILTWALDLEAKGILGEGLSFSQKEKELAQQGQNINIQNFQGVLGNVSGGSIAQSNQQSITSGNFSSLAGYLKGHGISQADLNELEAAVSTDPVPKSAAKFGKNVGGWIGKMMTKAADGSWEVGVAAAGGILATAIGKFYGLS